MTDCHRYYAAACQIDLPNPKHRDEIPARVKHMLNLVEYAVVGYQPFHDVRLVVFPEFAHAAPIYPSVEELLDRLAMPIPCEQTDRYVRKAKELGVFIQTGTFLESDERWPGHVFNATCLIGPDGLLAKYRKVHTWIPWEIHTSPHDLRGYDLPLFPVTETEIGHIGTAICYDWLFPEAIRQLGLAGAEILVRVSAYMDPWGTTEPLSWWTMINRVRAIENMCYVVAANQAARLDNYPPFSWPGGSMIVDYDGRILAQAEAGAGARIVVGPIDLAALRYERERRRGHHLLAHLRSEAYGCYARSIYPPGQAVSGPPSTDANDALTAQAREALRKQRESGAGVKQSRNTEQGRMTGVHARCPPLAGIRPAVYALSLPTSHQGCCYRAGKDDRRSRPLPAAGGYSARRLRRVRRDGTRPRRTGRPVLKHGPDTADAEKGRERPYHGRITRTANCE